MTNAVRHARAERLRIVLAVQSEPGQADEVRVSVEDDGLGAPRLEPGNGLRGMAERMGELGGSLQLSRLQPGLKTELRCPRSA